MLGKLFRDKALTAAVPAGERIYAIGDIHGCDTLLDALLAQIEADDEGSGGRLIFLGDYVDRGPGSKGVIDRLIRLKAARPDTLFLKGNHEEAMLGFLDAPELNDEWLHWGGDKTLESYGIANIWTTRPADLAVQLKDALPPSHLDFLKELELYCVAGDYAFVHAGFKPGVALDAQREEDCLWIRGEFHNSEIEMRPDKVVVHGHHPVKKPLDAGWRIAIDTGAVWSDALTAVVLEGTARRFISTGKI